MSKFLNKVLALTHPDLYEAGAKGLEALHSLPNTKMAANHWHSVFSGIAVISNRKTIPHCDRFGHLPWYDLLISVGTYCRAHLIMKDLGADFIYDSGTAVLLCGKLLVHEVPFWGAGDRVCWAHFLREATLNRLGALNEGGVGWSTMDKILRSLYP